MPWLRRLASVHSSLSPCFDRRSAHLGFVVDEVVLGHDVLRIITLSPVSVIPSVHHTPLNIHVALTKGTKCRSLGICQKTTMLFQKWGALDRCVPYL